MEITTYKVKIASLPDPVTIFYLGDIHSGSGNHNSEALKKQVRRIAGAPGALWIGMGDYGDHVYYTDPRFSPNSEEIIDIREMRQGIMGQTRKIAKELEPIKDSCIGLLTGNHEEKIANKYHTDPTRELCSILGTEYLGYLALIRIWVYAGKDKKPTYSFSLCVQHGTRAPRTLGGKLNVAIDGEHSIEADIYAVGHSHGLTSGVSAVKGISSKGQLYYSQRAFIVTSSFMENAKKGTMNYAEKGNYPQSPMRCPYSKVWIDGTARNMEIEVTT